jgi:hypothetical protein
VRNATKEDFEKLEWIDSLPWPNGGAKEIVWGELHRSGYHKGITCLHHFYAKRNFLATDSLWRHAGNCSAKARDAVRLLLLSYNASHATLMTRVVVKKNSRDFVLTGAQSGVLYISGLPVEKNVFLGVRRKLGNFTQAFSYLGGCSGSLQVKNLSSRSLRLPSKTVDFIFTDPPFGDFIPYAEVNQINELWLGESTDRSEEITISQSQGKDTSRYQAMMTDVFREMHRVLKDGGHAAVVFHSSKASVWNAMCSAYSEAAFVVEAAASLEKSQSSFKQVVSSSSVHGDPLILLSTGKRAKDCTSSKPLLDEAIDESQDCEANERKIYSSYIGKCLRQGMAVEYDAKDAYQYILGKEHAVD